MAKHFLYTIFAFCYICLVTLIIGDDHGVVFLYPTSGLTLNYLDTVNVSYTSHFTSPLLYTFCYDPNNTASALQGMLVTNLLRPIPDMISFSRTTHQCSAV